MGPGQWPHSSRNQFGEVAEWQQADRVMQPLTGNAEAGERTVDWLDRARLYRRPAEGSHAPREVSSCTVWAPLEVT